MDDFTDKECRYCKKPMLEADEIVVCSQCGREHHKKCWLENRGCTTQGCVGTIKELKPSGAHASKKFCHNCGAPLYGDVVFCTKCGTKVDALPNNTPVSFSSPMKPYPDYINPDQHPVQMKNKSKPVSTLQKFIIIFLGIIIVGLAIVAVNNLVNNGISLSPAVTSTPTATATRTPVPTSTPTQIPPTQAALFTDTFSSVNSGWSRYVGDDGMTEYQDGGYRILVNDLNSYYWAYPGLYFSDVVIDVDATKIGGSDNNDFGVICRLVDNQNFYFAVVASDGYYWVGKFLDGEEVLLDANGVLTTDEVYSGYSTNHIRFVCEGPWLTLYVNDEILGSYNDYSFESGDVGLIAGTFSDSGVDISFDNYIVTAP